VQFSLSNDNTVLSESVEGLGNGVADSVGFVFLPKLPKKILLFKDNSYLGWIRCNLLGKNIYKVPKYVIIGKIIPKERCSEALRTTKVVNIH
jgi:hypothetical protein